MYRTNQPCAEAGRFKGDLVVSMRPFLPKDAIRAIQICTVFFLIKIVLIIKKEIFLYQKKALDIR